ncbi:MAG: GNAT family N-acetyltransferase [Micromonosporaceae bacterium]
MSGQAKPKGQDRDTNSMELTVTDAPGRQRFEAWADGKLAGFAQYIRSDDLMVFTHMEVEPEFEGRGIGGALARAGLDDAAARKLRVRPLCPFIAGWIARHPDYKRLTGAAHQEAAHQEDGGTA